MVMTIDDIRREEGRFELDEKGEYDKIIDKLLEENMFLKSIVNQQFKLMKEIGVFLCEKLKKIPEIKGLYINHSGSDFFEIITILEKDEKEIRDKIFSTEYEILNKFKDYTFEFIILVESDEIDIPNNFKRIL